MITKEQLKSEIDSVEDSQTLELVYQLLLKIKQGNSQKKQPSLMSQLRSVQKIQGPEDFAENHRTDSNNHKDPQQKALDEFCGTFDGLDINSVEDELRLIRKGRRRLWDDI